MIYVCCDWHLYTKDPNEHHPFRTDRQNGQLAMNYGEQMTDGDILIHLGDICDPEASDIDKVTAIVRAIPGRKILCKGNHDILDSSVYEAMGFEWVGDIVKYHNIYFSHKPIRVAPDEINVHGHLHTEKMSAYGPNHINAYASNMGKEDQPIPLGDLINAATVQEIEIAEKDMTHIQSKFAKYTSLENDAYEKYLDISDLSDDVVENLSESATSGDELPEEIIRFNNDLNTNFLYGIAINRRIDPKKNYTPSDYDMLYRMSSPQQFLQQRGGTCWDYVSYEAYWFKHYFPKISYRAYYVMFPQLINQPTHTFLVFDYVGRTFLFESAFHDIRGLWVAESDEDFINFEMEAMANHNQGDLNTPVYVCQYDPLDPRFPGMSCTQYMNFMAIYGRDMDHKFDFKYRVESYKIGMTEAAIPNTMMDEIVFGHDEGDWDVNPKYWMTDDDAYQKKLRKSQEDRENTAVATDENAYLSETAGVKDKEFIRVIDHEDYYYQSVDNPTYNGYDIPRFGPKVRYAIYILKQISPGRRGIIGQYEMKLNPLIYPPTGEIIDVTGILTEPMRTGSITANQVQDLCKYVGGCIVGDLYIDEPAADDDDGVMYRVPIYAIYQSDYMTSPNSKYKQYEDFRSNAIWLNITDRAVDTGLLRINASINTLITQYLEVNNIPPKPTLMDKLTGKAEPYWEEMYGEKYRRLRREGKLMESQEYQESTVNETVSDPSGCLSESVAYLKQALLEAAYEGMPIPAITATAVTNDITLSTGPRTDTTLTFYNDNQKQVGTAEICGSNYLSHITVEPRYRNKKYGSSIMDYIMQNYDINELCVDTKNEPMLHLSKKHGFKKVDQFEDYRSTILVMKRGEAIVEAVAPAPSKDGWIGTHNIWNSRLTIDGKTYKEIVETIITKGDEILIRIKPDGTYRFPGGSTEPDISLEQCAIKECQEEVHITPRNLRYYGEYHYICDKSIEYDGRYTHIFVGEFWKNYNGYVKVHDRDEHMLTESKWRKVSEVIDILRPEHQAALREYMSLTEAADDYDTDPVLQKNGLRDVGNTHDAEREYEALKEKHAKERQMKELNRKRQKEIDKKKKHLAQVQKHRKWGAKKAKWTKFKNRHFKRKQNQLPGVKNEDFELLDPILDVQSDHMNEHVLEMIDKVQFFDHLDEATTVKVEKVKPVYIFLTHTGTGMSKMIKTFSGAEYSHSSISFDSSMSHCYTFANKPRMPDRPKTAIGGFQFEDLRQGFYKDRECYWKIFMIPCTESQINLMKKRLDYFIKNDVKFTYNCAGLVTNFFGVSYNPEWSFFCSQFVADILNSGKPNKMYNDPSLIRPEDLVKVPNAVPLLSGNTMSEFDPKKLEAATQRALRQKKIQKLANESALDIPIDNPYAADILNYQLTRMDEAAVEDFLLFLKSFKLRFDDQGNILITRREFDQLEKHLKNSLRMIKTYEESGNIEGVKEELFKIHYMSELINQYYLRPNVKNQVDRAKEVRKDMLDLRSVMLNAFKQHLAWVLAREPHWNFNQAYQVSKYGDQTKVPQKFLTMTGKAIITALA